MKKKLTNHNPDEYITSPEFNNLAAEVFDARLARANLVTKTDFDGKLKSLNQKIKSNKTKHLLLENELKKLETFHSVYFRSRCTDILKGLMVLVVVIIFLEIQRIV